MDGHRRLRRRPVSAAACGTMPGSPSTRRPRRGRADTAVGTVDRVDDDTCVLETGWTASTASLSTLDCSMLDFDRDRAPRARRAPATVGRRYAEAAAAKRTVASKRDGQVNEAARCMKQARLWAVGEIGGRSSSWPPCRASEPAEDLSPPGSAPYRWYRAIRGRAGSRTSVPERSLGPVRRAARRRPVQLHAGDCARPGPARRRATPRPPSRVAERAGPGMAAGDGRLQRVRAERLAEVHAFPSAARPCLTSVRAGPARAGPGPPAAPVGRRPGSGGEPGRLQFHQRHQPCTSAPWQQRREHPAQAHRVLGEVGADPESGRGRRRVPSLKMR